VLTLAQAPFAVPSLVVRTLKAYPQSADLTAKALAAMAPFATNGTAIAAVCWRCATHPRSRKRLAIGRPVKRAAAGQMVSAMLAPPIHIVDPVIAALRTFPREQAVQRGAIGVLASFAAACTCRTGTAWYA